MSHVESRFSHGPGRGTRTAFALLAERAPAAMKFDLCWSVRFGGSSDLLVMNRSWVRFPQAAPPEPPGQNLDLGFPLCSFGHAHVGQRCVLLVRACCPYRTARTRVPRGDPQVAKQAASAVAVGCDVGELFLVVSPSPSPSPSPTTGRGGSSTWSRRSLAFCSTQATTSASGDEAQRRPFQGSRRHQAEPRLAGSPSCRPFMPFHTVMVCAVRSS